jgi:hypothetical protein
MIKSRVLFLCREFVPDANGRSIPSAWNLEIPALAPGHPASGRRLRDQLRKHMVEFMNEHQ